MVSEVEALLIGGVGGLIGGILSVGFGAYLRKEHMKREFVWKRKAEVYDQVLRDLSYLRLITGLVMNLNEFVKEKSLKELDESGKWDTYNIRGYLVATLDVLESFVWCEFPSLRKEFVTVRKRLGRWTERVDEKCPVALRTDVEFLMQRVGLACWGRMVNSVGPLGLLAEKGSELYGKAMSGHTVWHEIQKDVGSFDSEKVGRFWNDFMEEIVVGMRKDLKGTLRK